MKLIILLNFVTLMPLLIGAGPSSLFSSIESIGFLSDLIDWPIGAVSAIPLSLQDTSPEPLLALPVQVTREGPCSYGAMILGNGEDRTITVLICQGEAPRVWVDANNDEDLTNDGDGLPDARWEWKGFRWSSTVRVEYDNMVRAPYHAVVTGYYDYEEHRYSFIYGGYCHRRGLIELEGRLYPIAISDLSSDGLYDDLDEAAIAIDTDGDGELQLFPDSYEIYGPNQPLQVGERLYRIKSVPPDGRRIEVEQVGIAPPPAILAPGQKAPDFEATTFEGQSVKLSDYHGKVVVLVFWNPSIPPGSRCCEDYQDIWRVEDLNVLLGGRPYQGKVVLLGIATSAQPPDSSSLTEKGIQFPVIWDPGISKLYRRSLIGRGLFVIDREGIIRDMDLYWVESYPDVQYHRLRVNEIVAIVEDLLLER
ncbi:MAG: peroxiredoxin family protein [Candidatus Acetothermia bacterium]|nr:peroxiredoxin family protein [Candidatus Acetothermia bacterium]MDH7505354.1 peroxiredoxin family protein [Candidatus Acetothermia bacterium]